jgi:hypothetical protein
MTNAPDFNNNASQREKQEVLRNERKLKGGDRDATTYHALSRLGQDEEGGGRFAQARYVTGSEPSTRYPAASSPWTAGNDAGLEMPTGVPIDQMEPVGEQFEIEASIAEQELGEPTDAVAREIPSCAKQSLVSAARVGSPPPLTGAQQAPTEVAAFTRVVETAASVNTAPPDGLDDVPRRSDGWPLSSHTIKRRKLTTQPQRRRDCP